MRGYYDKLMGITGCERNEKTPINTHVSFASVAPGVAQGVKNDANPQTRRDSKGVDRAGQIAGIMGLPLSDAEKAALLRALLGGAS